MVPMSEKILSAKLAKVARLREEADELERTTILDALTMAEGFEARAAQLLGIPRTSLQRLLQTRHKALAPEAAAMRGSTGYKFGKPKVNEQ